MNKVILIGNLTKDPEFTTTNSGVSLCKFTIAVGRRFANTDGERETDFINITTWRNIAESCKKYLKKGNKAGINGSLQNRSYDAQDGTKRYVTEIIADEVEFLSSKFIESVEEEPEGQKIEQQKFAPIDDNNLPF